MMVVIYEWIAYRFLMLEKGYDTHLPSNVNWGMQLDGFPMAIGIIAFALLSSIVLLLHISSLNTRIANIYTKM